MDRFHLVRCPLLAGMIYRHTDGLTDGQADVKMYRQINGQTDVKIDGQTDRKANKQRKKETDIINRHTDGHTDR